MVAKGKLTGTLGKGVTKGCFFFLLSGWRHDPIKLKKKISGCFSGIKSNMSLGFMAALSCYGDLWFTSQSCSSYSRSAPDLNALNDCASEKLWVALTFSREVQCCWNWLWSHTQKHTHLNIAQNLTADANVVGSSVGSWLVCLFSSVLVDLFVHRCQYWYKAAVRPCYTRCTVTHAARTWRMCFVEPSAQ